VLGDTPSFIGTNPAVPVVYAFYPINPAIQLPLSSPTFNASSIQNMSGAVLF